MAASPVTSVLLQASHCPGRCFVEFRCDRRHPGGGMLGSPRFLPSLFHASRYGARIGLGLALPACSVRGGEGPYRETGYMLAREWCSIIPSSYSRAKKDDENRRETCARCRRLCNRRYPSARSFLSFADPVITTCYMYRTMAAPSLGRWPPA